MNIAPLILRFIFVGLTVATGNAATNRWWLDINLTSQHSRHEYVFEGSRHEYNSRNLGLGLAYDWRDWCDLKAGWFNNSYHRTSLYAVVHPRFDLLRSPRVMLAIGVAVGAVTGYNHTVDDLPPLSPLGILTVTVSDERHWRLLVGYEPFRLLLGENHADVATLQVS
ncbi:MAG TPA: hypothetical protein VG734_17695, partial [Lacunisphaera sp.]|nr:hypothetical protein [Lacunisphaera sp.]